MNPGTTGTGILPRAWIDRIQFSDSTEVRLEKDEVVVIVGPNNAGKSATLRAIRDKAASNANSPVVIAIGIATEGSANDVTAWLDSFARKNDESSPNPVFQALGGGVHLSQISQFWSGSATWLQGLSRFFVHLLTADERLQAANPASSIALLRDAPSHPIHFLIRDDRLEARLSQLFRSAFGQELVVNRSAGSQVPLHVGKRPIPAAGEDRVSFSYVQALEELPLLHLQGDGMRSFAGVLLYTSVGRESILLIDEPEAFLHPPQARALGQLLVNERKAERQLFIATHSGDVLRGILGANSSKVRVVRLRRDGALNVARQLDNTRIAELWNDPLLRYSNILDGLFHERVVVCEADSDARFYAAVAEAMPVSASQRRLDVMFTHCGGKERLAVVVRALRAVEVPVSVAVDFDVLSSDATLGRIVEAAGGLWANFETDWKLVKSSIDNKKAEHSTADVKEKILQILTPIAVDAFPSGAGEEIRKVLRVSSPWSIAKNVGKAFVPAGDSTKAFERLDSSLRTLGIFIVDVGELECFDKSIGNHGPKWVNDVLKKDLATDPSLQAAREYVQRLGVVVPIEIGPATELALAN
jgi:hypothetical protein